MAKNIKLGQVLVESGYINEQQLEEALRIQQSSKGKKLGSILLDIGIITEEQLMDALQRRLNVPLADIRNITVPMEVVQLMSEVFARDNSMLPIRLQGNTVIIATSDPLNYNAINEFEVQSGRIAVLQLASQQDIENAIDRVYSSSAVNETAFSAVEQLTSEDLGNVSINEAELRASSAPVVRLVNQLIEQAYKQRASDIHIEPYESTVRIRMRIDGELKEVATIKPALLGPILTRIKIAANLDIAEKRIPQDGRISIDIEGTRLNLRVSTIATVYGEKAVLRLLSDSKSGILTMSELGMNEHNSELLHSLLRSPNGIILVTGPTGSGKTTTLYAAVAELSQPTMNIVSVEDPVEKVLPGINQTQITPKAGLTFASGLRALLRQDPDIMLVGEIRDEETARSPRRKP
jgi:type IV pilus assembly protein PilB